MIRAYYYSAAECGLDSFPDGLLRLGQGAEEWPDPSTADVLVCPAPLRNMGLKRVVALPHWDGNKRRHVFFNVAEDIDIDYPPGPLYLRCDATARIVAACPSTQAWPWPVADLYDQNADRAPFAYDVVFQGWASTELTDRACEAVAAYPPLRAHLQRHKFFYGYHDGDPAYAHYRTSYIDTLRRSRLSLVPRSIPAGVIRYRFYEAMSAGRIPVHLCDGRVLPWQNEIDWDRCSLHVREANAPRLGPILAGWFADHDDKDIRARGRYGREMWLRYLDRRRWPDLFTEAVRKWLLN